MTRLLSLFAALSLVFVLAACGGSAPEEETTESSSFEDRFRDLDERVEAAGDAATEESAAPTESATPNDPLAQLQSAFDAAGGLDIDFGAQLEDLKEFGFAQKDRFLSQIATGGEDIEKTLADLEARGADLAGQARTRVESLMDQLRSEYASLKAKTTELAAAGVEEWDELSEGARANWERIQDLIAQIQAQFDAGS